MPSTLGAPAQFKQPSRKGKKAWRKHIDISDVEKHQEQLRVEERVTGGTIQTRTNDQLFEVDIKGDEKIRKKTPKLSLSSMKSLRILRERSAVPAVRSNKQRKITHEEKKRMLAAGRRKARNAPAILDDDETPIAVNDPGTSGTYDVWTKEDDDEPKVKPPASLNLKDGHPARLIPVVTTPHPGTSYNPAVEAHQALLLSAHEIEEKKEKEEGKWRGVKEKMLEARKDVDEDRHVALGMKLDIVEPSLDSEPSSEVIEEGVTKRVPKPKTKQQRRKAAALLAEKRAREATSTKARQIAEITKATLRSLKSVKAEVATKKRRAEEKNLAGKRLGKHVVPPVRMDVQLGEELSESFRGLEPEGSLFRDRFENLQQRALVEPRVRVLPPKRKRGIKDYEKHPWKRFT